MRVELLQQGHGNLWRAGGYQDGIVRGGRRPAHGTIALVHDDISVIKFTQGFSRHGSQLRDDLSGVHLTGEHGKDCCLVA